MLKTKVTTSCIFLFDEWTKKNIGKNFFSLHHHLLRFFFNMKSIKYFHWTFMHNLDENKIMNQKKCSQHSFMNVNNDQEKILKCLFCTLGLRKKNMSVWSLCHLKFVVFLVSFPSMHTILFVSYAKLKSWYSFHSKEQRQ